LQNRRLVTIAACVLVGAFAVVISTSGTTAQKQEINSGSRDARDDSSPWALTTGSESLAGYPRFNPLLRQAGVRWLRAFYEWQVIQPQQGYWNWVLSDRLVENARANHLHLTFALAYFAPWASADGGTRRFPIKDIQYWREYVGEMVRRYHKDVKYWEVWNEFNGSFAENGSPKIYADLVREASISAKKIDPDAKVGLSVANFDVGFLDATIKAGAANYFDYICIHPYETLSRLSDGGEVQFLDMASSIRQMLVANNQPPDIPLWITEIGAEAPAKADEQSDRRQAVLLSKAYLLSIASGIRRVFWFEAIDPPGAHQTGLGLLRSDFTPRPSYEVLKRLTDILGPEPASVGWLKLGDGGYGFVFNGSGKDILAAWAPPRSNVDVKFSRDVNVVDLDGQRRQIAAGQSLTLTGAPQFISDVPPELMLKAKSSRNEPYPWTKDYSQSQTVNAHLQASNVENGLRQVNPDTTVPVLSGDISWRRTDFSRPDGEGHYVYFAVDPKFMPFGTRAVEVAAKVKRIKPDMTAGLALTYESMQGYVDQGYVNIPEDDQWHVLRWTINNANFVGAWGWNFRLNAIGSPNDFLVSEVAVRKLQ
jgi:hypothetical protein